MSRYTNDFENPYFIAAIEKAGGVKKLADELGVHVGTLRRQDRKYMAPLWRLALVAYLLPEEVTKSQMMKVA